MIVLSARTSAHLKRASNPIRNGCDEPPCECWELKSGPLEVHFMLLITEPHLQPWSGHFYQSNRKRKYDKEVLTESLILILMDTRTCLTFSLLAFIDLKSSITTLSGAMPTSQKFLIFDEELEA